MYFSLPSFRLTFLEDDDEKDDDEKDDAEEEEEAPAVAGTGSADIQQMGKGGDQRELTAVQSSSVLVGNAGNRQVSQLRGVT